MSSHLVWLVTSSPSPRPGSALKARVIGKRTQRSHLFPRSEGHGRLVIADRRPGCYGSSRHHNAAHSLCCPFAARSARSASAERDVTLRHSTAPCDCRAVATAVHRCTARPGARSGDASLHSRGRFAAHRLHRIGKQTQRRPCAAMACTGSIATTRLASSP